MSLATAVSRRLAELVNMVPTISPISFMIPYCAAYNFLMIVSDVLCRPKSVVALENFPRRR